MASVELFCSACGAANRFDGRFCFACGSLLAQSVLPDVLPPGHILKQRFRVLRKLGEGGFGTIYLAEDLAFKQALRAIKEMRVQRLDAQERQLAIDAFQQEAMMLAGLAHQNLPRIYDYFEDTARWYLVMDFIHGDTLEERISTTSGGLVLQDVLTWAIQLCTVLGYLHSCQPSVIFRDLKPANVMLTSDQHLYLIDFGIARLFKPGQSKDTIALGSPGYAAPEQFGRAQTTAASDIYSLGATLHHVLSGRDPGDEPFHFPPLDLTSSAPVGPALAAMIEKMVQIRPEQRPASMEQIKRDLQHLTNATGGNLFPSTILSTQTTSTVHQKLAAPEPLETGNAYAIFQKHRLPIKGLAWLPDNRHLVSLGIDGLIYWHLKNQHAIFTIRPAEPAQTLTCSPDGARLALTGNQSWQIYSLPDRKEVYFSHYLGHHYLGQHPNGICAQSWSPDGRHIALGTENGCIFLWDVKFQHIRLQSCKHIGKALAISWSPDSSQLAVVHEPETICILYLKEERQRLSMAGMDTYTYPDSWLSTVAWSSDGTVIAAGNTDGHIQLSRATTGEVINHLQSHRSPINALAWSPDGRYLVSGNGDGAIRVWEAQTARAMLKGTGHRSSVNAVTWSSDGRFIASGGDDSIIRVWEAPL